MINCEYEIKKKNKQQWQTLRKRMEAEQFYFES